MSKFDALSKSNKFDELRQKLQQQKEAAERKANGGGTRDDSWKFLPELPADKPSAKYTVRILPNVHDKDAVDPWIQGYFHMFRRSDGKFIYTMCPTTLDPEAKCPICEKAKKLYATKDKADEEQAQKIYRKLRYFVNVYVKADPRGADKNQTGKVVVYEFGKKLFDKFTDAILEQQLEIVNPINGHDFMLVIKKQGEFTNYDSSLFVAKESPVHEEEEEMNKIYDSIINLREKVIGRGPQSYEKLVEMLTGKTPEGDAPAPTTRDSAAGGSKVVDKQSDGVFDENAEVPKTSPKVEAKAEAKPAAKPAAAKPAAGKEDDFDFDFDEK
jgi:outer membrane murein-binding lipoprotein Lpp